MKRKQMVWIIILCLCTMASAAMGAGAFCEYCNAVLDPKIKGDCLPIFYSNDRVRNMASGTIRNVQGIKAGYIQNCEQNNEEYGVYLKFTPSAKDDGFYIDWIDIVICAQSGDVLQVDHMIGNIVCSSQEYWQWDFYSLNKAYMNMIEQGKNIKGSYTIHVFFNGKWAGKTITKVH